MYDSTAILYKDGTKSYDTYGNEIITRTSREVFVYARGVYNAEFYKSLDRKSVV